MREINYKSDFDFILHLKDCNGSEIGVPSCDFAITLWTSSKANVFKASRKGDRLENCFIDGGQIHVMCKNHRMGVGDLHAEFHAELPNDIYPEGIQNRYEPRPLDIRLVTGAGECPTDMEAEMHLPVIAVDNNTGVEKLKAGDILDISFVIATGATGRVRIKLKDNADIAGEFCMELGI